jgi:hypothetical protein
VRNQRSEVICGSVGIWCDGCNEMRGNLAACSIDNTRGPVCTNDRPGIHEDSAWFAHTTLCSLAIYSTDLVMVLDSAI